MGRYRNPRYAPESLERKLSPSTIAGPTPAAAYAPDGTSASTTSQDDPPAYAAPGDDPTSTADYNPPADAPPGYDPDGDGDDDSGDLSDDGWGDDSQQPG